MRVIRAIRGQKTQRTQPSHSKMYVNVSQNRLVLAGDLRGKLAFYANTKHVGSRIASYKNTGKNGCTQKMFASADFGL